MTADSRRPVEEIALKLASYGVAVGAEDPQYVFADVMEDNPGIDPKWRAADIDENYPIPKPVRISVQYPSSPTGVPREARKLLDDVVQEANRKLPFAYRLDVDGEFYTFVPTKTRSRSGQIVDAPALLDRQISIPAGSRKIAESANLMTTALSSETGLHVACCEPFSIGGNPAQEWGFDDAPFEARNEPARRILARLIRLNARSPMHSAHFHWLVGCYRGFCFINVENVYGVHRCAPAPD